jgi:hypothetical protein
VREDVFGDEESGRAAAHVMVFCFVQGHAAYILPKRVWRPWKERGGSAERRGEERDLEDSWIIFTIACGHALLLQIASHTPFPVSGECDHLLSSNNQKGFFRLLCVVLVYQCVCETQQVDMDTQYWPARQSSSVLMCGLAWWLMKLLGPETPGPRQGRQGA